MWVISALLAAGQAGTAPPADTRDRPELLVQLVACSRIADVPERVACYDRQVAALDRAERERDVVLVERSEVRQARRSLFGFAVPKLKIFEGDGREPEFTRIEASLTSAQRSGGKWLFDLDDGTRWLQSDSEEMARSPRAGDRIRIRRAAMGSFLANVGTAPAIRVRRVE